MEKDQDGKVIVSELGKPRRYITDHNAEGKAVFNTAFDENVSSLALPGFITYDSFTTPSHPVQMNDGADLKASKEPSRSTSICPEKTTVARFVDFLPGMPTIWHRTLSLDYGVLIFGELELLLDSGESRLLKPGDLVVQRGTEHAWRNPHPTNAARAFYVQSSTEPLVVQGKVLEEHTELPDVSQA
ncbi:hypothetical protein FZEAL_9112 [Fusarium zealandicum]|uniref:Uncharacterized protein n=1 Tax=Fusarium zealandicum TaxID=1053134 RepID=A0A8H4UCK8_9HYPO|nr:hypothetical protein FZEAL_9112 [Fusarium zealandicum]